MKHTEITQEGNNIRIDNSYKLSSKKSLIDTIFSRKPMVSINNNFILLDPRNQSVPASVEIK